MKKTKKAKRTSKKIQWLTALISLLIMLAMWRNAQKIFRLPPELAGQWKTSSDPSYADRSLELSPGYVTIGTGNGTATIGFIQEVKISQEEGKTLYTIIYQNDDGENQLSLYYESARGDVIRFKNQPGLAWTKVPGS